MEVQIVASNTNFFTV